MIAPILPPSQAALRRSRFVRLVSVVALAASLGACATRGATGGRGATDITGSIPEPSVTSRSESDWQALAGEWRPRYEKDPGDKQASMNYARALRALRQQDQAVAVMQNAAIRAPEDREVLALYGRTLADAGRFDEASKVLANAHSPDQPDWRIYNVQGTVADQLGDFRSAQGFYDAALKIMPNDPSILSNLGLSYALQRKLTDAEAVLRQAANDPRGDARIRANLALVLALEGKFGEAEDVAKRDLSAQDAAANIAYIRSMVTQANSWQQLKSLDKKAGKAG